jgi:hypothetical protein
MPKVRSKRNTRVRRNSRRRLSRKFMKGGGRTSVPIQRDSTSTAGKRVKYEIYRAPHHPLHRAAPARANKTNQQTRNTRVASFLGAYSPLFQSFNPYENLRLSKIRPRHHKSVKARSARYYRGKTPTPPNHNTIPEN